MPQPAYKAGDHHIVRNLIAAAESSFVFRGNPVGAEVVQLYRIGNHVDIFFYADLLEIFLTFGGRAGQFRSGVAQQPEIVVADLFGSPQQMAGRHII